MAGGVLPAFRRGCRGGCLPVEVLGEGFAEDGFRCLAAGVGDGLETGGGGGVEGKGDGHEAGRSCFDYEPGRRSTWA